MTERRKLVELWKSKPVVALATLVGVEGSSYRATGARLLIAADGTYTGSISGGCLEAEIVRKAPWLVRKGAVLQRYSTLFDDTAEIPYGLGCGGTVEVLIEPAETPEFRALMEAFERSVRGGQATVKTTFDDTGLWREIRDVDGRSLFSSASAAPAHARSLSEQLDSPQKLFLFGAGDDASPLVSLATLLGWSTVVIDSRSQWARTERFPAAEHVLCIDHLEAHGGVHLAQQDAVVLMTHSYEQDRRWLEQVLPLQPRYLGLLGSRHRSALLIAEAATALGWSLERACEGLFAPVGLDLGGDGAEAVALSIAAEIQGCIQGKVGRSRRVTPEMVEDQIARGGASRYLQAQCAL